MENSRKLEIINGEPNLQRRLELLVSHGFKAEAKWMILELMRKGNALLHYDWHDAEFCKPLKRVTKSPSAIYVIITSSSKLDYHPSHRKEGEWHIVFELGWEQKVLGWGETESRTLVSAICSQVLARPLNQWSLKQAEGTSRAARRVLPATDMLAREIAALHLVFQLRQADFGHIYGYLRDIADFPYDALTAERSETANIGLVNWIIDKLIQLGWTQDRVHKELVEWLWLKTETWPQWLLAVAKAKVFSSGDQARKAAVRHWLMQGLDYALRVVPMRSHDRDEMAATYQELFDIGGFGTGDKCWVSDKLVAKLEMGDVSAVEFIVKKFGLATDTLDDMLTRAQDTAVRAGRYGIAVGLARRRGVKVPREWLDIVKVRKLSTGLK